MKTQMIRFRDLSIPLKIAAVGGFLVVVIWIITIITSFAVTSLV